MVRVYVRRRLVSKLSFLHLAAGKASALHALVLRGASSGLRSAYRLLWRTLFGNHLLRLRWLSAQHQVNHGLDWLVLLPYHVHLLIDLNIFPHLFLRGDAKRRLHSQRHIVEKLAVLFLFQ